MKKRLRECIENKYENRIAPFLWLHRENDEDIIAEIDKIYESGIRAICIESRTHNDFCNNGWWEDVRLIMEHCKALDMKDWILDDKHFPSGYANNIFAEKYKALRRKDIMAKHMDIAGPLKDGCVLADAWKTNESDKILAAVLCKRNENDEYSVLESAKDVTENLKNGLLYLDVPEGYWRVVFLIEAYDENNIFSHHSDKLNPLATDALIEEIYEAHYRETKEYFGNVFLGFFSDEPGFQNNFGNKMITALGDEKAYYPWHEKLMEKLFQKYGGKLWEKLVNIFFEVKGEKQEVRETYMDIITHMYNENYSGRLASWCHNHGVMYIGHIIEDCNSASKTGSTAGNYFRALEGQDMSGIDVVLSQLVPGMDDIDHKYYSGAFDFTDYKFYRYSLAKLASSMAHTNERMNGNAMCEIFGAYGWAEGTKLMKYLTDFMLVRGINYFVPHAFSPKENDTDCPPNFYARGTNPQFKFFKKITEYMNKCSYLLTEGSPVISCGVLYDTENRWNSGEILACDNIAEVLLNNQIDFDYVCQDYLLNATLTENNLKVVNSEYEILLVPYSEYMKEDTLKKLRELEKNGLNIVWINDFAKYSTDGENAQEYTKDAKVVSLEQLADYIYEKGLYDIRIAGGNKKIKFCHRRKDEENIYMFVNEDIHKKSMLQIELKDFTKEEYIIYNPLTDELYKKLAKGGKVEINLHPYEALMLITGMDAKDIEKEQEYERESEQEFFEYEISLAEEGKGFEKYFKLEEPKNINAVEGLDSFSGHVKYTKTFTLEKDGKYELDLGNVGETAEVIVNGKNIGSKICPPYTFDISKEIIKGKNKLEVIVTNTLVFNIRDSFSKFLLLEPTGLMSKTKIFRLIN